MKELLEGRRIGFGLRPPLANVALGLGLAITLLDVMAWAGWGSRDTNGFVVAASWLCVFAAIVGVLGLATAVAEMADVPDEERTLSRLDAAAVLGAVLLYAASAVVRSFDLAAAGASPPALLMAVGGLIVLAVGSGVSTFLYAPREWEEIEDVSHERHRRRRAASR